MPNETPNSPGTPTEATLEQQLSDIMKPAGVTPATAPTPKSPDAIGLEAAQPSQPPVAPAPPTEGDLTKKLEAIEEPSQPPAPTVSPEQQEILQAIPSKERLQQISNELGGFYNFQSSFASGDFKTIEGMFEDWNPEAWESFLEHIYQSRVASEEWVKRWISEKEGSAPHYKELKALGQQVNSLKSQLDRRQSIEQANISQARQRELMGQFTNHLEGLFDKINFSKVDRRWVTSAILERAASDPQVTLALREGRMTAANKIFKDVVTEYSNRDKETKESLTGKESVQTQKKELISTTPVVESALPDDINQVKSEDRDTWLKQKLTSFMVANKKK